MYESGGIENAWLLADILMFLFGFIFLISLFAGLLGEQEPSTSEVSSLLDHFQDEQDVFAVLTGDEEYLAAHCTLKEEPLPVKTNTRTRVPRSSGQDPNSGSPRVKPKQKAKPKQAKPHTTDVGKEAAMGLVSLGYKKSDANRLVDDILTNNPNMTSDQVVMEVFNK